MCVRVVSSIPPDAGACSISWVTTFFISACISARRMSTPWSARIWSVSVPRRSVSVSRLWLTELRSPSPRAIVCWS